MGREVGVKRGPRDTENPEDVVSGMSRKIEIRGMTVSYKHVRRRTSQDEGREGRVRMRRDRIIVKILRRGSPEIIIQLWDNKISKL